MPATGAEFGIKQNDYINIFYDPVGNTDSAVRYLRQLYSNLGDWNLAISAYNCGKGNVRKAIKKAGSKNYWKVRPYYQKKPRLTFPHLLLLIIYLIFIKNIILDLSILSLIFMT